MSTAHTTDHDDIRRRIDNLIAAICAMNLEAVMPIYARDIVSFDFEPPLQHVGAEAKRQNWTRAFTAFEPPLHYEVRDLTITAGGDVAFVHAFARMNGTLKNGKKSGVWVRWTPCFRKIDGTWLIVHDQVSVPADIASGKALLNLEP